MSDDPAQVVQRQLDAYNRKSIDEWLDTYHSDAEQFELHGPLLARGHEAMRARIAVRFEEPDLYAELLDRIVMGNVVVDHERIRRNFPEGPGTVEMLCIYEVLSGRIARASFALGARQLSNADQPLR